MGSWGVDICARASSVAEISFRKRVRATAFIAPLLSFRPYQYFKHSDHNGVSVADLLLVRDLLSVLLLLLPKRLYFVSPPLQACRFALALLLQEAHDVLHRGAKARAL